MSVFELIRTTNTQTGLHNRLCLYSLGFLRPSNEISRTAKCSDQPAHLRRQIGAFVDRISLDALFVRCGTEDGKIRYYGYRFSDSSDQDSLISTWCMMFSESNSLLVSITLGIFACIKTCTWNYSFSAC